MGKIEFISQNPLLFSGLQASEVEKMGYNFFRDFARKEDIKILKTVHTKGFQFYECLTEQEKKTYSICYDFHLKSENNIDVLVNHKLTPIDVSEDGKLSKIICFVYYSLHKTAGNICVTCNLNDHYWEYNLDSEKWIEKEKIVLKPREIEVIRLYLQGLNIDEIARKLFVSPNTVKFHRSKLFEKIGVNNINEAISFVISNNLL